MRLHPPVDPSVEVHAPLADPEVGKPGRENRPVDPLPGSDRIELGVVEGAVGGRPFDPGDEAENLGGGVDKHRAPLRQPGDEAAEIGEEKIRPPRRHDPRRLEDRHVSGAAVTGIPGGKPHWDRIGHARLRQLDPNLAPLCQRRDRCLPGLRPVALADVADRVEGPKRRLPRLDQSSNRLGVTQAPFPPRRPHGLERQGGGGIDQRRHERRKILRAHAMLRGRFLECHGARQQAVPFGERRGQAGHQRRPAAGVGIEGDPLEIDARRPRIHGVASVDVTDAGEGLLCPVALRRRWAEADSVGREDRMGGDLLGSVEILVDHLRGHHERLSDVREALAGGTVDRKLLAGIERRHAREIAEAGGVFSV